jgi:hypothetical protein
VDKLVLLDVRNLWSHPEHLEHTLGESTSVPVDMAIVDLLDTGDLPEKRVGPIDILNEVQVVEHGIRVDIVFEHDDVRVVDSAIRVITRKEGRKTRGRGGAWGSGDGGDAEDSRQDPVNEWRHDVCGLGELIAT